MKRYGFLLRRMTGERYRRSCSRKAASLKHVPSHMRKWLKRLPMSILFTAGRTASELLVDPTHRRFNRHALIDSNEDKREGTKNLQGDQQPGQDDQVV